MNAPNSNIERNARRARRVCMFLEGSGYTEIAKAEGISTSAVRQTIRSQVHRLVLKTIKRTRQSDIWWRIQDLPAVKLRSFANILLAYECLKTAQMEILSDWGAGIDNGEWQ